MELVELIVLPFVLVLGRVAAFFSVLPLFSWQALPVRVRAAMAFLVAVFIATTLPARLPVGAFNANALAGVLLLLQEVLTGLALGMAVSLVYLAAGQAGRLIGLQAGLTDAAIIDPTTGEEEEPMGIFFDVAFALLFLAAGGHHLLLLVIGKSYQAFPVGQGPDIAAATEGLVRAGSLMLLLGLKLAAPVVAAFMVLSVVLAILARVMPEMNVLFTSLPLRMGLGLLLAAAILPSLAAFTAELGQWIQTFMMS